MHMHAHGRQNKERQQQDNSSDSTTKLTTQQTLYEVPLLVLNEGTVGLERNSM